MQRTKSLGQAPLTLRVSEITSSTLPKFITEVTTTTTKKLTDSLMIIPVKMSEVRGKNMTNTL
jgi:maltodextrin utilization protein YvdJ